MSINLNKGILAKIRGLFVPVGYQILEGQNTVYMEPIKQEGVKHIDDKGISLIQHFEDCKLKAYQDSAGIWTIGWGATAYEDLKKVKKGDTITQDRADELLSYFVRQKERVVLDKVTRPLSQHEFNAAVSFCYNAGTGYKRNNIYYDYNIWVNINNRLAGEDMRRYWENLAVTAGGVKLGGLVRRRKSEAEMYLAGELNFFQ